MGHSPAQPFQHLFPTSQFARSVIDLAGAVYTLEISSDSLLLNGEETAIAVVDEESIHFSCAQGRVTFSLEALGQAFVGENIAPTLADIGGQLAQNLMRWSLERQTIARLRELEQAIHSLLETYTYQQAQLFLPKRCLDPFVGQVLQRYTGTPESEAAIAMILGWPLDQIRALLAPAALVLREINQSVIDRKPASTIPSGETAPALSMPEKSGAWFEDSEHGNTPLISPLTNNGQMSAISMPTLSAQGSHPAGETKKRDRFRWDTERETQLKQAFASAFPSAHTVRATARIIADRMHWPVSAVDSKIRELSLHRQDQPDTESSTVSETPPQSSQTGSEQVFGMRPDVMRIEKGNRLWNVTIDGRPTRWPLPFTFGDFPLERPGAQFIYEGQAYALQRAWNSSLDVTIAQAQFTDELTQEHAAQAASV
jgi:hypothetical protein